MLKVIHVHEIRVHPSMLEARSDDTPAGYVHVTLAKVVEEHTTVKGKPVVDVFTAQDPDFKADHICTNPRVLELANEMRTIIAQEVADEHDCAVRASSSKTAAFIQPA